MFISLTGLSYKTAPVEIREKVYLPETRVPEVLQKLREALPEAIIFSTCNRFEILTSHSQLESAAEICTKLIAELCGLDSKQIEADLYHHTGVEALRHVFRVASSLDSMVIGESQILGQLKSAFVIAQNEHSVQQNLHLVMERAFSVAKKVRTETMIASKPVSVSSVAVDLASKVFGDLTGKTVFVVGAGKMSLLSIQHLRSHGVRNVIVANRTFEKAEALAKQVDGRAVPMENFTNSLAEADIVISSTGASDFVICPEHVKSAMAQRKNRPMLLVDIAVPRDIDPEVHKIGNVFLYDIDDLQTVMQTNMKERLKEADKAEALILREAEQTWKKFQAQRIAPTIRGIQEQVDEICRNEIQNSFQKFGDATEAQRLGIERLAFSLAEKLLQGTFSELRYQVCQPDGEEKIQYIRELFLTT